MGKYFGTDGVRGMANTELDAALAYKLGYGLAWELTAKNGAAPLILIGCDTRLSGDMLTGALCAGITAAGGSVRLLGVLPTPAVARAVAAEAAVAAGIVVSASHNPYPYNGIKVFGPDGYKLTDEEEAVVEGYIDAPPAGEKLTGAGLGRVTWGGDAALNDYVAHLAASCPEGLAGLRAVIDCANGASYRTARKLFPALGLDCTFLACDPDGININENCGSTHLEPLKAAVKAGGYDIGVAFDGDADRCLLVDETGEELDGDAILGILAQAMQKNGTLKGAVAVTVMSNLGLHSFLKGLGVGTHSTKVGDRYVLEDLRQTGGNLGGEQSGHVILLDRATTGDGQLTAVTFLSVLRASGKKASELSGQIPHFPQVLRNVPVPNAHKKSVAALPAVKALEAEIAGIFGAEGRILIRPSGTEPLVRVMVEGRDMAAVTALADKAAAAIGAEAANLG